jgi:hypothetical protein
MVTNKKSNVTFYAEPDLKKILRETADASGRSMAGQVKWIIREYLQRQRREKEKEVFSDLSF